MKYTEESLVEAAALGWDVTADDIHEIGGTSVYEIEGVDQVGICQRHP